jgi:alkylation response protein AidB-like acyl-CoA dehydrogenase
MNLFPDVRQQALMDEADSLFGRAREPSRIFSDWSQNGWFADVSSGDGLIDQALLFRVLGRHLAAGPFLATTLAAALSAECGEGELSERIAAGQELVALAHAEEDAGNGTQSDHVGTLRAFDLPPSNYVLVVRPDRSTLVERNEKDLFQMRACIDPSVSMGMLTLAGDVRCHGGGEWWVRGGVLVAAMAAGIAEATRDDSALYARTRSQFGRPIGMFQAIKHRCSEMAIQAEAAWCQVAYAVLSLSAGHQDAMQQVSAAKVVASAAATENSSANIQNHGALGCTTEHSAHLYLKRSWVLAYLCGTTDYHQRQLLGGASPR